MPQVPRGMTVEDVEADWLCQVLQDPATRARYHGRIKPMVFSTELHARMWRAIEELLDTDQLVTDENIAATVHCSVGAVRALWSRDRGLDQPLVPHEYAIQVITGCATQRHLLRESNVLRGYIEAGVESGQMDLTRRHMRRMHETCQRYASMFSDPEHPLAFLERVNTDYHWLVPGILERRDRLMVVAGEGSGKSVLLRQWAMQLACGAHWATGEYSTHGKVLVVDCENSEPQIARELRRLVNVAHGYDPAFNERIWFEPCPKGLDLSNHRPAVSVDGRQRTVRVGRARRAACVR
jgi:hypothetical protein